MGKSCDDGNSLVMFCMFPPNKENAFPLDSSSLAIKLNGILDGPASKLSFSIAAEENGDGKKSLSLVDSCGCFSVFLPRRIGLPGGGAVGTANLKSWSRNGSLLAWVALWKIRKNQPNVNWM